MTKVFALEVGTKTITPTTQRRVIRTLLRTRKSAQAREVRDIRIYNGSQSQDLDEHRGCYFAPQEMLRLAILVSAARYVLLVEAFWSPGAG